MTGMETLALFI